MKLIKPSKFYNESTLDDFANLYANTNIEHAIVYNLLKSNISTICITDIDGTYINTNGAVRNAQANALSKIANMSFQEAYRQLETQGLKNSVEKFMSLNDFFKGPYKTFDSVQAAKEGSMKVFQDAIEFTKSGIPTIAISNSSQKATENKLKALKIKDNFVGIYAAYLQETAKPKLYLAKKAIKELNNKGWYNSNQTLIHVGDQEYDVQFGNKIKTIHPNTINVLIDRGETYRGNTKPDVIIKSFNELYNL